MNFTLYPRWPSLDFGSSYRNLDWLRRSGAAAVVVGVVIASPCLPAAAHEAEISHATDEARPPGAAVRDGAYFRFSMGVGYGRGTYFYEGRAIPYDEPMPRDLRFQAATRGIAGQLQVAVGHAVLSNLSIGVEGSYAIGRAKHEERLGYTRLSVTETRRLVLFADYFFHEAASWHTFVGAGLSRVTPMGSRVDVGAWDNIVNLKPLWGPAATLGVGYVWSTGFGLDARLDLVSAAESRELRRSSYRAATLSLLISYINF